MAGGLVAGAVVYDHLAQRTGRVVAAAADEVALADAGGTTRWTARGLYRLALEPLEAPSELALVFEAPLPAARRAALLALGPVERAVALCRGLRTGPLRGQGERAGDALLAEPVTPRELARAHEAALGAPGEGFVAEVVARLVAAPSPWLRPSPSGLRLVLDEPSWLLDRLVLDRTWRRDRARAGARGDGRSVAPLVRADASGVAPHEPREEEALAWALREVVRIEGGVDLEPVDAARGGELRARLWAVFRPSVAQRTDRRLDPELGWIDPDTVPEEVLDRLLEHLRGRPGAPAAAERLRAHLARPAPGAPTSQLVRNALYGCLDALRAGRDLTAPRHGPVEVVLHDGGLRRPIDGAPEPVRALGFDELRAVIAEVAPRASPDEQRRRAHELLHAIRRLFARQLEALRAADPVKYRTLLLDFTTLLSRPRIAGYTGIHYDTFRWWFPRAGARETRPPRFVRGLLPDALQGFVGRFGRVFPVLQLGLLPRADEIDAVARDEAAREALAELFLFAPLDGRGEFWGEEALRRAAGRTGADVEGFIDRTLFPFLEALLEHRRARDLARGADLAPVDAADLEVAALALLLLGAPDGRALGRALAAREAGEPGARRAVARAAGLAPLDLVDLELGRRWARPDELDALARALGPGALAGLAPDLAPDLAAALEAP
ncbi:MAG: hypothetical protein M9894_33600 [Planctomycetes bacterium]|nr:hypothetical protein [Planctomycetota bacterium]